MQNWKIEKCKLHNIVAYFSTVRNIIKAMFFSVKETRYGSHNINNKTTNQRWHIGAKLKDSFSD